MVTLFISAQVVDIAVCWAKYTILIEANKMRKSLTHTLPNKHGTDIVVRRQRKYDYLYGT